MVDKLYKCTNEHPDLYTRIGDPSKFVIIKAAKSSSHLPYHGNLINKIDEVDETYAVFEYFRNA